MTLKKCQICRKMGYMWREEYVAIIRDTYQVWHQTSKHHRHQHFVIIDLQVWLWRRHEERPVLLSHPRCFDEMPEWGGFGEICWWWEHKVIIKILLADYFNPILSLQVSILNLLLRAGCKPDQDCVRLAQLRWPQVLLCLFTSFSLYSSSKHNVCLLHLDLNCMNL